MIIRDRCIRCGARFRDPIAEDAGSPPVARWDGMLFREGWRCKPCTAVISHIERCGRALHVERLP